MISNFAHKVLLDKTIAELALQNTIDMSIFFLSILEQKDPNFQIWDSKDRRIHYMSMHRKIATIVAKLADNQKSINPLDTAKYVKTEDIFSTPRVYDDLLWKCQCDVYSEMTELLHDPTPDRSLLELLKSPEFAFLFSSVDNSVSSNNTDTSSSKGVCFVEYILLLNIFLTTHGRSLGVLNRPLKDKRDRRRARKFLDTMQNSMHSEALIWSYVNTFFQVYLGKLFGHYNQHPAEIWNDQIYMSPISLSRSEYYTLDDSNVELDSVKNKLELGTLIETSQLEIIPHLAKTLVYAAFTCSNGVTPAFLTTTSITSSIENTMDKLFSLTFTIQEEIILVYGNQPVNINPILRKQYLPAIQYARIIYIFISKSIQAAKKLLTCFAEFSVQKKDASKNPK